jgi:hypothetical protein
MSVALSRILTPGMSFRHSYDFGTSTELGLRVVGQIAGAPDRAKIYQMARNLPPAFVPESNFNLAVFGIPDTRVWREA